MKSETFVFGKIIKKYEIDMNLIKDLNDLYEVEKDKLFSLGKKLAGRLDSELEITHLLAQAKIGATLVDCMNNYIQDIEKLRIYKPRKKLHILSCWINDMKAGEYNPPHTHHDNTGFSTVLFLKVPEFINDVKEKHKFRDGKICFIGHDGTYSEWAQPKVGDFFIFEANHIHAVMPFKVKNKGDIRRSMSFNFIDKDD